MMIQNQGVSTGAGRVKVCPEGNVVLRHKSVANRSFNKSESELQSRDCELAPTLKNLLENLSENLSENLI